MKLTFVSTNKGKFKELKYAMKKHGIELELEEIEIDEMETGTLEEIAEDKAMKAYAIIKKPLIAEDTGIFFDAYDNYPGVNAKKIWLEIGFEGLLGKLEGKTRTGSFQTVICYVNVNRETHLFRGIMKGTFLDEVKYAKEDQLPFKRIFMPEGWSKPFSDFSEEEVMKVSQRAKAADKLVEFLK